VAFELPHCIETILKNKNLLKKHYHALLKFVNQYKPEALHYFLKHLINEGIDISLNMDAFEPFSCEELREFCSSECPLQQDVFSFLVSNTEEVFVTQDGDDSVILLVTLKDGNKLKLDLNSDGVGRSLASQVAYHYKRYVDLDLRRKKDRQKWSELINFWLSKAKKVKVSDINEEDEYIRNIALDYLYSVQVKPESEWNGDYNCAVTKDGVHALFLKEALRLFVSNKINAKISFKKLTTLLAPEAESVWVRVKGTRYAFYKYKMSDRQKEDYEKYLEKISVEDSEGQDLDEDDLFDDSDWDLPV